MCCSSPESGKPLKGSAWNRFTGHYFSSSTLEVWLRTINFAKKKKEKKEEEDEVGKLSVLSLLFPSVFILRNIIVLSPAKEKYNGRRQEQGNLKWNQKPVSKSREMLMRIWNHKRLIFQSMRFIALTFWKKSIKQKRSKAGIEWFLPKSETYWKHTDWKHWQSEFYILWGF